MISIRTHQSDDLTAADALKLLDVGLPPAFLDVRSETEFAQAHVPGFRNAPILRDSERHEVGLKYRHEGREAAIRLGLALTAQTRQARLMDWLAIARSGTGSAIVTCWRGGLRSKFATEWLREEGVDCFRVRDGYQALRGELLLALERLPRLLVLSGYTGVGKTEVLKRITPDSSLSVIDLEGLAGHRGSSFGATENSQPFQAVFENHLCLAIRRAKGPLLLEAESATLGGIFVPKRLKDAMARAPVVVLESPLSDRVARIFVEYVETPWHRVGAASLELSLVRSTRALARRLGDALTRELVASIEAACRLAEPQLAAHARWIEVLLTRYYDRAYEYSFQRQGRRVLFKGDASSCLAFCNEISTYAGVPFASPLSGLS